jgi:hypothetical protein
MRAVCYPRRIAGWSILLTPDFVKDWSWEDEGKPTRFLYGMFVPESSEKEASRMDHASR